MPHYRAEPRYAAWSTFKVAEWVRTGGEELTGSDVSLRWPDAGTKERDAVSLAPQLGEKRSVRTESATVALRTDDGQTREYSPASLDELPDLAPGTTHLVRVDGKTVTFLRDE